jgi:uncharacterized damage-inducible protein DinB
MKSSYTTLLEELLESWHGARAGVIDEIENIPAERVGFRPAEGMRTVEELGRHIAEVALMMVGELTRPDGDFTRQSYTAHLREHAAASKTDGRDALIRMLRDTHAEGDRRFRAVGELAMLQYIRRFDGQPGTRLAWLCHGIAHEEYHRAQIAMYARIMGLVPALTRAIQGEG